MIKSAARMFVWSGTRPRSSSPRKTPGDVGCNYLDVTFPSAVQRDLSLSGWLIYPGPETPSLGTVILCHGHTSTRTAMLSRAALLSKHHFTTLVFDFRARGLSGGAFCTLGALEQYDVIGAVNFIKLHVQLKDNPIAVLGSSMGGAAAIFAAAKDERISCLITEGTFANLLDVIEQRASLVAGKFSKVIATECVRQGNQITSIDVASVRPEQAISTISPRPVLLITNALDITCPRGQSDRLFEAASEPKERWIASSAPHCMAFEMQKALYETTVVTFLNRAFDGAAGNAFKS